MNTEAIEQAIRDCGVPGRLAALDGKLIRIDLLDETTERLERHVLGFSEFCDLALDWRARTAASRAMPAPGRLEAVAA